MYGFVYSQYNETRGVFYDGHPENLRYCRNQEEAKKWWAENEGFMTDHTMKLYAGKYLKVKIPIKPGIPSDQFFNWVMGQKLHPIVQQIISMLLDDFQSNDDGTFTPRLKTDKEEAGGVLQHMRDIIEGIFRISPLKIPTGSKKDGKQDVVQYPLGQSIYEPISYKVAGKEYKTGLWGIYSSSARKLMFPLSDFDGHTLQKWQRDAYYRRGQYTYIIAPREGGKSMSASSFTGTYLLRELCYPSTDLLRGVLINYYGQSAKQNKAMYNYVKAMLKKIMQGATIVKFDDANQIISMEDDGTKREIQFISQLAESKGRGERPSLVIIDEAARIIPEIYEIAMGTSGIPIIFISTVNYETRRNWFYDDFIDGEREQRHYEPIDMLIHRLWTKYEFDKIRNDQDVQWHINNNSFEKIREEFYLARPIVSLRYTIDDIDEKILSPAAKEAKLKKAEKRGEKFVMAEYYGFYVDEEEVFNADGLTTPDLPKMFEHIAMGFDPAQKFDNAAAVAIGLDNNIAYVIESRRLSADPAVQCRELREFRKQMAAKSRNGYCHLAADISRGVGDLMMLEDRDIWVDYPISYTKGTSVNIKGREHLVGKEYLVKIAKEQYFWKNAIRIWERLSNDGGLLDELADFRHKQNGKWEAGTGKDDQVNAMMVCLYLLYDMWMKDYFVNSDAEPTRRVASLQQMIRESKMPAEQTFQGMVTFWN